MAEPLAYNTNLRADIQTHTGENPKARVHSSEWVKILNGDPVEINPSVGYGYKVLQKFFVPALKAALHSSRFFLIMFPLLIRILHGEETGARPLRCCRGSAARPLLPDIAFP